MLELRVEGVSCRYDSVPVLDGIKFSIDSHQFIGIIGPNGSGKTTLLRTVSRVLRPVLGVVMIDGRSIHSMPSVDAAREMAVVPQESHLGFNFTGIEVVLMGRTPHLGPFEMETQKDLEISREAMVLTRCLHLANRRVNELSGGEKRKVLIARALAQQPRVLLLDEPVLNLDVNNQIELMDAIRELCKEKELIVLSVFHDFNMAAKYSDKILLLDRGRVFSLGPPEDVLTRQNLREVFRVDAEVTIHPITRMNITILSTLDRAKTIERNAVSRRI